MTTPILLLDEWSEAQAAPHVTVNEALRWLECFAELVVLSQAVSTPPGSPAEGDRYIVAPAADGVWSGQDGKIALYLGTAWGFRAAPEGAIAYVSDEAASYRTLAGVWTLETGGGGGGVAQRYSLFATINPAALTEPSFRVPVAGDIARWSILTEGGAGDCVLDIRKTNPLGAAYPPVVGDSICPGVEPAISADVANNDDSFAGWDIALVAGDVLTFVLVSSTVFTAVHCQIDIAPS